MMQLIARAGTAVGAHPAAAILGVALFRRLLRLTRHAKDRADGVYAAKKHIARHTSQSLFESSWLDQFKRDLYQRAQARAGVSLEDLQWIHPEDYWRFTTRMVITRTLLYQGYADDRRDDLFDGMIVNRHNPHVTTADFMLRLLETLPSHMPQEHAPRPLRLREKNRMPERLLRSDVVEDLQYYVDRQALSYEVTPFQPIRDLDLEGAEVRARSGQARMTLLHFDFDPRYMRIMTTEQGTPIGLRLEGDRPSRSVVLQLPDSIVLWTPSGDEAWPTPLRAALGAVVQNNLFERPARLSIIAALEWDDATITTSPLETAVH